MTLPPKALTVLASIKARLIPEVPVIHSEPDEIAAAPQPRKAEVESRQRMRHARRRGSAWQRACQRRDWFAPVP